LMGEMDEVDSRKYAVCRSQSQRPGLSLTTVVLAILDFGAHLGLPGRQRGNVGPNPRRTPPNLISPSMAAASRNISPTTQCTPQLNATTPPAMRLDRMGRAFGPLQALDRSRGRTPRPSPTGTLRPKEPDNTLAAPNRDPSANPIRSRPTYTSGKAVEGRLVGPPNFEPPTGPSKGTWMPRSPSSERDRPFR
jgi:hypothetical protein